MAHDLDDARDIHDRRLIDALERCPERRRAHDAAMQHFRHADVVQASRNPEVFSSGKGATSIADLPVEFNEYFGSMINMDDPRHARLRRIGCDTGQGWLYSRPVAPQRIDELLATGSRACRQT